MANILSLSNELLLEIISYLRPLPPIPPPLAPFPFILWPTIMAQSDDLAFGQAKTLYGLALVCRRFRDLTTRALYYHLPLYDRFRRSFKFLSTLQQHPHLSTHLRSVDVDLGDHPTLSEHVPSIFFLPNIHTICLYSFRPFDDSNWWKPEYRDRLYTSPVQILRLIKALPHDLPFENAMDRLLRLPKALKELWYDATLGYYHRERELLLYTAANQAITNQEDSLEKVVYTGLPTPAVWTGEDSIFFRHCEKLKSLSISHTFLVGMREDGEVWERLPTSLEELEVHYEDGALNDLLVPGNRRARWLFDLLARMYTNGNKEYPRGESTPSLERVRLVSTSHSAFAPYIETTSRNNNFDFDERRGIGHPEAKWRPPAKLLRYFIRAGVSFSIFINPQIRYRYIVEGGKGFQDEWEDTWEDII